MNQFMKKQSHFNVLSGWFSLNGRMEVLKNSIKESILTNWQFYFVNAKQKVLFPLKIWNHFINGLA